MALRMKLCYQKIDFRKEKLEKQMTDTDGNAHWTIKRNKAIQKFKTELKELLNFEIWSNSFKTIEGKFGTAVMSYFRFVKWLLFLNLYVSLVFIGLILLPHLLLNDVPLQSMNVTASCHQNIGNISLSSNTTNVYNGTAVNVYEQAYSCSEKYRDFLYTHRQKEGLSNKVLDFLQGTVRRIGWMENTELFYGKYSYFYGYGANRIYNMGLFYLVALGISSILCFLLLVRNSGKGLKQRVLDRNSELTQFANKVLTGWDYCIMDSKAAKMKRISTKLELESDLENQRIRWRKKNRTSLQKWKIIIIRFIVNFVVLSILVGSLYLIYFTNEQLIQLQRAVAEENILQFLVQYLPSVTITLLNIVIPIFFNKIILIENYSPVVEMRMTLTRTVFLRLASLGVLLGTLYGQIHVVDDNETNRNNKQLICGNKKWNANLNSTDEGSIKCWETFVGQQFYKLVLVDFLAAVIPVFIVEFPRRLIFDKFKDRFKIINLIGRPEFDLPKSVLDLVYSQTLCWMGLFFSPLIPAMTVLTVLQNYIPPIRPYRTSRSNSLFITVLLFSFTLSVFPVSFMVGNIQPSQSCGPFRVYIICEQNPIDCPSRNPSDQFVIYYHWIVSVGLQKSEELIKEQLVQEGRDKKFVWMRIIERRSQGHPSVDCE
ncbi:hypothetical protein KUTeg_006940 [Tegillarca granosa]|uniref:TMC domain-containing protein n=1 Tax=Tegillarca granosa TaxID=220873 RepID=A0ABQ9FGH4_TEGGR|nr:hypothetical protein KUTeg_006940 [Tegillarca granosa]